MAKASIESRVTQTGSVGPVAAAIIGAVTLFIAQLPVEALGTACTPDTHQQDTLRFTTTLKINECRKKK